jgi:hypothetical protein
MIFGQSLRQGGKKPGFSDTLYFMHIKIHNASIDISTTDKGIGKWFFLENRPWVTKTLNHFYKNSHRIIISHNLTKPNLNQSG